MVCRHGKVSMLPAYQKQARQINRCIQEMQVFFKGVQLSKGETEPLQQHHISLTRDVFVDKSLPASFAYQF